MAAHLLHHALNQCPPFFCKDHIYETGVFVILDHCYMAGPFQTPANMEQFPYIFEINCIIILQQRKISGR